MPGPIWWLRDLPKFLWTDVWPLFWPIVIPMGLLFTLYLFLTTPPADWNKAP